MLEHLILGIVCEQNATGYEIKKIIETKICMFYKPSYGSLYPALKRLVSKGALSTYEEATGARKKIVYQITHSGKNMFMEWLSEPIDISEGTDKSLVKIYFYDLLPDLIRIERLAQCEMYCKQRLKDLERLHNQLSAVVDQTKYYYKYSTLIYGIGMTKAAIKWFDVIKKHDEL